MRAIAVASLLLVTACTSTSVVAARSASPYASSASTASASASASVGPSPAPVFFLPPLSPAPTAPSGQCYLPLTYSSDSSQISYAGFFEYPAGVMAPGSTTFRPPSSTLYSSSPTYDRAAGRWLPVPPDAISPDGLIVAYADYDLQPNPASGMVASNPMSRSAIAVPEAGALATTGRVHVVDARTGLDRILYQGAPTYSVVGFTSDGIYLARVELTMDGQFASGLFLINPAGGIPQPVVGGNRSVDRSGWEIVNGAAWGSDFATGEGQGLGAGNQLVRLDLKTGAVQVWMTKPNEVGVTLLGIDTQGELLVHLFVSYYTSDSPPPAQPSQLLVLSAPDTGKVVYENSDPNANLPGRPWFADAKGVWFSSPAAQGAVWLYIAQSGFRAVSVPLTGAHVTVGGACV